MSKIITFGKECVAELRKVVWPTRDDVVSAVKVVIVSTILVAIFLGVVDTFFVWVGSFKERLWLKNGIFCISFQGMKRE